MTAERMTLEDLIRLQDKAIADGDIEALEALCDIELAFTDLVETVIWLDD